MEDHSVSPGRRRRVAIIAGLVAALVAITAGAVVFWPSREPAAVAQPQPEPTRPPTPFEQAAALLDRQAAALLKGDEKGWLAPVDPDRPKLVARYRSMFRNLRGLDVSHAEFHAQPLPDGKAGAVTATAMFGYCFSGVACPTWRSSADEGPPKVTHHLTFEVIGGEYTITAMTKPPGRSFNHLEPAPWDGADLVFARGKRVTVAATRSQAKQARKVLAVAEKSAAVTDRFAGYVGNRQHRYRIYLADDRAWKTWYGGDNESWVIGYQLPLNSIGADVVLRSRKLPKDRFARSFLIQHELAHVVTLAGLTRWETDDDQWLLEGIAEYIGAYPRKADTTSNWDVLAAQFRRGDAPRTIATPSLTDDADDRAVDRLYAMGHFATNCMADKYGDRRLSTFVNHVLRKGDNPDEAARAAYGKSFAAVDKACLKWIRKRILT